MQYRTQRGESLSEIGFGCYALSGAYGQKDAGQFVAVIQRAYDLGVTFFDTADIYGPAEEVLGRAVAPFRNQVWIASKVGWGAEHRPDCSPGHVQASCETSLRRLGTDHLDLYQIHFHDPDTPVQVAIAWVLAQPAVVCALTGPSTIPHLEENVGGSGWTIEAEDAAALELFFETEDEWLQQEQIRALQSILTGELEADAAFADLVYVVETLVDMDLALEEEIMPIYERLMPSRKRPIADSLEELQCLQTELRGRVLSLFSAEPCAESRSR